jgi:Family of unknown function (DUF5522)
MPEEEKISPEEKPEDNLDKYFYYENGLMVFTEAYHLLRGYCCERGCRHCPYGFKPKSSTK